MVTEHRINGIPTRLLGSTGSRVTILGIGGYHIGKSRDANLGVRIIRTAIDEGINFLDNAWCYNDGESERIMGQALGNGYRERVFLMTKNHGRDAMTFERQLEQSLRRLGTEVIDLVQFHEVIHDDVPRRIFQDGALDAAVRARDAGKIRFIGFTGHRWPRLHREMLDHDFPWDTVQFPSNVLDAQFRSFTGQILPILKSRGIGAIGMKSLAGGQLLQTGISPADAIHYAMSLPIDTLVSGMDSIEILHRNLDIARSWSPMDDAQQRALLDAVAPYATDGHLERYKTA